MINVGQLYTTDSIKAQPRILCFLLAWAVYRGQIYESHFTVWECLKQLCHNLNAWVSPKFIPWSSDFQCDGIWSWGFWEVIRFWLGRGNRSKIRRAGRESVLRWRKRDSLTVCAYASRKGHVGAWWEVKSQERALTRTPPCGCPHLPTSSLQNCENVNVFYLSHTVYFVFLYSVTAAQANWSTLIQPHCYPEDWGIPGQDLLHWNESSEAT